MLSDDGSCVFGGKCAQIECTLRDRMLQLKTKNGKLRIDTCALQFGRFLSVFAHFLAGGGCEFPLAKIQTRRALMVIAACAYGRSGTLLWLKGRFAGRFLPFPEVCNNDVLEAKPRKWLTK